jgi:hypothetical protein
MILAVFVALTAILILRTLPVTRAVPVQTNPTYTRYVSPSGDDADTCLLPAHACRHIGKTIDRSASGDRIILAPGTYDETLSIPRDLTIQARVRGTPFSMEGARTASCRSGSPRSPSPG